MLQSWSNDIFETWLYIIVISFKSSDQRNKPRAYEKSILCLDVWRFVPCLMFTCRQRSSAVALHVLLTAGPPSLCHLLFNAKDNGKWKMGAALRLMDGKREDRRPNDDVEI